MTERKPYAITVQDLVARGRDDIPAELVTSTHLIYNSPAALAFNSPGAQGFGVKRAGLSIPGSVMLLVGPGCCGRNTTILSEMGGYSDRFFFYIMDETDIVTGRHLKKIPQAVCEVVDSLAEKPSVVMICMTCVDALLGTDMERVCRKAEKEAGLPVVPCYMYALTREGRKPPMVDVRRAIYSLLEKQPRHRRTVNLLGYFAPLQDDCELYDILRGVGFNQINEISRCPDFAAYKAMSQANVNIILNPEARLAAQDMEKRLGIPSIELTRLYQVAQIHKQYQALAQVLGTTIDDSAWHERAQAVVRAVREKYSGTTVAIGEMQNGNAFEMALALTRYGFVIREIYANLGPDDFVYLRHPGPAEPRIRRYTPICRRLCSITGDRTILSTSPSARMPHIIMNRPPISRGMKISSPSVMPESFRCYNGWSRPCWKGNIHERFMEIYFTLCTGRLRRGGRPLRTERHRRHLRCRRLCRQHLRFR